MIFFRLPSNGVGLLIAFSLKGVVSFFGGRGIWIGWIGWTRRGWGFVPLGPGVGSDSVVEEIETGLGLP